MRIALLCLDRGVPFGGARKGASIHLQSFAAALLRQGHSVSAICAEPGDLSVVRELVERGLDVRPLRMPAAEREIDWHFSRVHPDLIVERLSLGGPVGAIVAREAGIPHVYEVNAPLDEEALRHRGLADAEQARRLIVQGFASSRGAVVVSDEVGAWVRRLAPADFPVAVEPNGAGPDFFAAPSSSALQQVLGRLRLGRGEFRIGFVGAFRPWHDLGTLVRAVGRVARHTPARLVLVGDGPARNEVLRQAWDAGAPVTLAGPVAHRDVPAHLALMDAVAVPYADAEAYFSPLKLFEAMAAARPIVASATHPVTRVVEHDREALLVSPGDADAMAEALLALARDPALAARLGGTARRTALACHTWDAVAERILRFAAGIGRPQRESCGH